MNPIRKPAHLVLAVTMAAFLMAGVAQSNLGAVYAQNNKVKALAGAWKVAASLELQGSSVALLTFTSDGIILGDEPGAGFETTAHGNWTGTGGTGVAYTFHAFLGSPSGQISGSIKVVGTLQYDRAADTWSGPFKVEVADPDGNVIFADRGTFKGTRIQIEALN